MTEYPGDTQQIEEQSREPEKEGARKLSPAARSLLRYGGFVASVGSARAIGILITSLTFPFIVRRLGVAMYGLWSYVIAVCGFIDTVANPGVFTYATQQIAARRLEAAQTLGDTLVIRLLSGSVGSIVILTVAAFEVRPDVRFLLRCYGIPAIFVGIMASDYVLGALELFHLRSLLSVVQQALYAVGVFVFVRSAKDVIWIPLSILASSVVSGVVGWVLLWQRGFRPVLSFAPHRWRAILVPSFHYASSTLMSNLYHRSGHIVVRWLLGDFALGLYAGATRFVDVLRGFISIAHGVLMPRVALYAKAGAGLTRVIRFAVSSLALLSIPLAVGAITTTSIVVPLVLGKQFMGGVRAFQWVAPYVITASAATLYVGTVLYGMGRYRAYLVSTTAGAVSGVALYLALTPLFGVVGACLAFVLGEAAVAITAYSLSPPEIRRASRTPAIPIAAVASFLMAVAVLLAQRKIHSLPVVALGIVVYLISCLIIGKNWIKSEFQARA